MAVRINGGRARWCLGRQYSECNMPDVDVVALQLNGNVLRFKLLDMPLKVMTDEILKN